MIDLNELAYFAAVATSGSFTQAAQKLGAPKSTISRRIAQLEERLGIKLLHRSTRQLNVTEAGMLYLDHCQRMLEEAEHAEHVIQKMQAEPSGQLRISTPLAFGCMNFLQEIIQDYLALYPRVKVDVVADNKPLDLSQEDLSLAFRVGPMPDSDAVTRNLGIARMVFCATPSYLAEHGEPIYPDDLSNHEIIRHPNTPIVLDTKDESILYDPPCRLLINDMDFIRKMTFRGIGIGLVPTMLIEDDVNEGRLVPILLDYPFTTKSVYLVYPSRRQLPSKVTAFIDLVMAKVTPTPPWEIVFQSVKSKRGVG